MPTGEWQLEYCTAPCASMGRQHNSAIKDRRQGIAQRRHIYTNVQTYVHTYVGMHLCVCMCVLLPLQLQAFVAIDSVSNFNVAQCVKHGTQMQAQVTYTLSGFLLAYVGNTYSFYFCYLYIY